MDKNPIPQSELNGPLLALLCLFFGVFGAHRFYAGKKNTAIAMLCTLGGVGVWALVDLLIILANEFRDSQGNKVHVWD
ncbi:TM2 domain-containing protein [Chitinimonas sp.]|uniref:TM2 domain-containing protein n=1 Tax=Chitinimonas sp. TaxID=1934313 RepID=UPI002F956EE4